MNHEMSVDVDEGYIIVICGEEMISCKDWPANCPICGDAL